MSEWVKCTLGDICSLVKDKIDVASLSVKNYISTENLLPEKGGIVEATSLPSVNNVSEYLNNDVLVSNIRPYFKKIWLASMRGGCSNDVLVFRSKSNCDSYFLYYLLSNDAFFDYVTKTAKGTKMPRGDKKAIMDYCVILPPLPVQKKIASILSSLDDKIELNTRMNEVLEEIARALFQRWFVEFEFPDAEGRPYKSAGGKMVESEMGSVPEGWRVGSLEQIIELSYGKPLKEENRTGDGYPVFGSNGIVGWHKEWLVTGPGIIVGRKGNAGTVTWSSENFFPIDTTFYVVPRSGAYGLSYIYHLLKTLNLPYLSADSAVPGLNRNAALKQKILIPDIYTTNEYEIVVSSLFSQIHSLELENRTLITIRETLLPKLMSGEIPLSEISQVNNKDSNSKANTGV